MVDDLLSLMDGDASMIMANKKLLNMIRAAARQTSQYVREPGPRGTYVERYGTARLVDLGTKDGSTTDYTTADVIPVNVRPGRRRPARRRLDVDLRGAHRPRRVPRRLHGRRHPRPTWMPDFTTPAR
jgi:hypothetical protein